MLFCYQAYATYQIANWYNVNQRSIVAGTVTIHAQAIVLTIHFLNDFSQPVADIAHVKPDAKTCDVLTGNHTNVEIKIVDVHANSQTSHCQYVIGRFESFDHTVLKIHL